MKTNPKKLPRLISAFLAVWLALGTVVCTAADSTNAVARKSPDWLKKSVVYEIFPRNFSKEGDFNAITARLDELKDLGVDIIWLMPIHPIGQVNKKGSIGSPYAVSDYYAVNPNYGTTNDFKRFVAEAHQRGIKVIMDIVAGHTSWDSVLMSHPEFYKKDGSGKIIPPNPGWVDVAALDYDNPDVRRYMVDMLKYWMNDYGVDGFRGDVAFPSAVEFWENARTELEQVNPNVILFADANASPKLLAKAFDMDNSAAFNSALNRVMSGIAPAYHLKLSWDTTRQQFPQNALHLRFTDDHENVRWVARFGLQGALASQVLILTLDGVPLFYNGMEVGDATESADPALFEKMPVYWTPSGRPTMRAIYSHLNKLRSEHPAFYSDDVTWLQNTASSEIVSFLRKDDKDEFLVLINLSSRAVAGTVDVPRSEEFTLLKLDGMPAIPKSPLPEFQLGSYEWRIYQRTPAK